MTRPRRAAALIVAACALASCSTSPPTPGAATTPTVNRSPVPTATPPDAAPVHAAPTFGSGIAGLTSIDGGCPVLRAETPCPDRPITARLAITDATNGTTVATTTSGTDGHFTVAVKPGRYLVRPLSIAGAPPHPQNPTSATVTPDRYTTITLRFDIGIR
jgi:hypothetical protein